MSTLNNRALIIERAAKNKPEQSALPDICLFEKNNKGDLSIFSTVLKNIGGAVHLIHSLEELMSIVSEKHAKGSRFYSPIEEIQKLIKQTTTEVTHGHDLLNVELAIIKAHFAVAENGAVWVTDDLMGNRALPFICQHLGVIINDIVPPCTKLTCSPAWIITITAHSLPGHQKLLI